MDIFTTLLTRVVPVPIKPASLKVKALLKDAGSSKLKEDPDHLENHDYYVVKKQPDNQENKESEASEQGKSELIPSEKTTELTNDKSVDDDTKAQVKHLDLYV